MAAGRKTELTGYLRRFGAMTMAITAGAAVLAVALFPLFVSWVLGDAGFLAGQTALMILLAGLCLASGFLVLDMLAVLADRPLLHSGYKLAVVLVNLAANFALVPWLGMTGAALGTAISLGATIVLLIWMGRRCFGLTVP